MSECAGRDYPRLSSRGSLIEVERPDDLPAHYTFYTFAHGRVLTYYPVAYVLVRMSLTSIVPSPIGRGSVAPRLA
jgi:hypothetical protein